MGGMICWLSMRPTWHRYLAYILRRNGLRLEDEPGKNCCRRTMFSSTCLLSSMKKLVRKPFKDSPSRLFLQMALIDQGLSALRAPLTEAALRTPLAMPMML